MQFYSIGKFAKLIGKTEQTLRNWDKAGTFKPSHVAKSGFRYYSQEQLNHFLGLKGEQKNRKTIGYCRVSSNKQLVEDLVQIITAFSCRLQGKRANKAKKMIKLRS